MAGRVSFGSSTIIWGFVAGALAVLVFHQLTILTLNGFRFSTVWQLAPAVPPFGVPRLFNQMFWGGLWGILLAGFAPLFPRGIGYYIAGFIFGAVLLALAGWYLVPFVKSMLGQKVRFGPNPAGWWRGPVINGMWGLGTAVFLHCLPGRRH